VANLLIIGGTRFMGYFATQHALARGHKVTLFNRGKSTPDAFPEAEHITGDRDTEIELLRGRRWDAVIDTCGYVPRVVRKTAELLKDSIGYYLFISSISVFADPMLPGTDENGKLATIADPTTEAITGETYGALKALCEQTLESVLPGRVCVVRPGLIVGPRDSSYRFTYWVDRFAQGGEVLAPGNPEANVQFIDSRDLGEWLIRLIEAKTTGIFNSVCPPVSFRSVLEACKTVSGTNASLTWVSEAFLLKHNVIPWQELPVWIPESDAGVHATDSRRAIAAGLTFRSPVDTIRATLDDLRAHPERVPAQPPTLKREREQELLAEWHQWDNLPTR